jgi:DNA-binding transcriptional ArsR family regulator
LNKLFAMSRATASADVFHAVAEPNRRQILDVLRDGEKSVGGLVEATGLSYSLVSQHLQVLLNAHTVMRRPVGRRRMYRLDAAPLRAVRDWTAEYEQFWQERISRLKGRLEL